MMSMSAAYSLSYSLSSPSCASCVTSRRSAANMKYHGGPTKWQPVWKAALDAGITMPAADATAVLEPESTVAEPVMTLSGANWLGGAAQVLMDKSLTETTEERVAVLLESGCPQSVVDSCLKNYDVMDVVMAPEPTAETTDEAELRSRWLADVMAPESTESAEDAEERRINVLYAELIKLDVAEYEAKVKMAVEYKMQREAPVAAPVAAPAAAKPAVATAAMDGV